MAGSRLLSPIIVADQKELRDLVLEAEGYKDDAETAATTATAQAVISTSQAVISTAQASAATAQAAAAATSAAAASAIVVSGDVSYDPLANQVPLARSNGKIDPQWIQGAAATSNSVEAGTATTGMLIPDTTEYVFTPAMTRVFNVFIPETLTAEILVYTHGTDGIYITTERRIRLNCGGGFYESDILPASVLGDSLEIAISRADNEASTVTVFFVVNGVQFGATQVSAFSDLYIRSLLVGIDGFFLTVSQGTTATTNAGTTRVSNPAEAIGLLYDGGGNVINFTQATGTARPLIGRVPVGGARNEMTFNRDFSNAAWSRNNITPTVVQGLVTPSGNRNVNKFIVANGLTGSLIRNPNTAGKRTSFRVRDSDFEALAFGNAAAKTIFNTSTGTISVASDAFNNYYVAAESDGWYRLSFFNKTVTQYQLQLNVATLLNGTSIAGDGVKGVVIDEFQIENGDTLTPFQSTTTLRDITQAGIPNVWYAFFDLSDDILTTTVPAITNGTIVIAGTNGIWIDTLTVSAGTFNLGATTHTGGPSGILAVIGNVIGAFVINRALTAPEQAAVVAYYKAKGSPGFFEVSATERVTNGDFSAGITGWTSVSTGTGTFTVSSGVANVTGTNGSNRGIAAQSCMVIGQTYLLSATASGTGLANFTNTDPTTGGFFNNTSARQAALFTATSTSIWVYTQAGGGNVNFDNVSIRQVTLNTGA